MRNLSAKTPKPRERTDQPEARRPQQQRTGRNRAKAQARPTSTKRLNYSLDRSSSLGPTPGLPPPRPTGPGRANASVQSYRGPPTAIAKIRARPRARTATPRHPPLPPAEPGRPRALAQPKPKPTNRNSKDPGETALQLQTSEERLGRPRASA